MHVIYTTSATATGAMEGKVKSDSGILNLEIRAPKEMGGPGGDYTNPEQLFAVGFASCFQSAINYVAMTHKKKMESEVTVKADTLNNGKGGFIFAVKLDVVISGLPEAEAKELVDMASYVCPFSNSTRGNVEVELNLVVSR